MATLANIPRRLEVGGREYLISALSQRDWAEFQGWIKEFVPRPEAPEGSDAIDRAAYRDAWPPAIASAAWFDAMDHPGCFATFVKLALGRHLPGGMPDEEAMLAAYELVDEAKVGPLVTLCMGNDPAGLPPSPEPTAGPKLPTGDSPGDVYFQFVKAFGWTHDQVMSLTFPQIKYYAHAGKPPKPGTRRFSSTAEARAARATANPDEQARDTESPRREPEVRIYGNP
jgi:hypothetical protein